MRFLPKLGLTAATVMASAGLLLPFAGPAGAATACTAPKGGSCQHVVHHAVHHKAVHRKAVHHGKGEHHKPCRHHEHHHKHHQRCRHHDERDD